MQAVRHQLAREPTLWFGKVSTIQSQVFMRTRAANARPGS